VKPEQPVSSVTTADIQALCKTDDVELSIARTRSLPELPLTRSARDPA